jgi:hypothetical protein
MRESGGMPKRSIDPVNRRQWMRYAAGSTLSLGMLNLPLLHATESGSSTGSSHPRMRSESIQRIPWNQLNDPARNKLKAVLDHPSYFRRMPSQTLECDPELFTFLVRHPEVIVSIWKVMGVTKVEVERTGEFSFRGQDGAGTRCQSELVYGTDQLHIFYALGDYDGSMTTKPVEGRCVCVLHSQQVPSADGTSWLQGRMDLFLKLDQLGADLIVRTIGPFIAKTADMNFIESAKFLSQLSQAAQRNPEGFQELVYQLEDIQPQVRDELLLVAAKSARRQIQWTGSPATFTHQKRPLPAASTSNPAPSPSQTPWVFPEKDDLIMRR